MNPGSVERGIKRTTVPSSSSEGSGHHLFVEESTLSTPQRASPCQPQIRLLSDHPRSPELAVGVTNKNLYEVVLNLQTASAPRPTSGCQFSLVAVLDDHHAHAVNPCQRAP